jgi:hypothetical protein
MFRLLFPYVLTFNYGSEIIEIPIIQEKEKLSLCLMKYHAIEIHKEWKYHFSLSLTRTLTLSVRWR